MGAGTTVDGAGRARGIRTVNYIATSRDSTHRVRTARNNSRLSISPMPSAAARLRFAVHVGMDSIATRRCRRIECLGPAGVTVLTYATDLVASIDDNRRQDWERPWTTRSISWNRHDADCRCRCRTCGGVSIGGMSTELEVEAILYQALVPTETD